MPRFGGAFLLIMIDRRFLDISLVVEGVADEPEKSDVGTQYIVGENPSGDFENAEPTQIARYNGEKWIFIPPKEASLEVINSETGEILKFDGMLWESVATLSGGSGSGGSSVLVVDDLAQVLTSIDERPDDYVLNYCIVDNGINSPRLHGYEAYYNTYQYQWSCYNNAYGNLPADSVLAGDNGKYYTLRPAEDNKSLIESSEMVVGTLVLNKKCNLFYLYDGTELKLIGGNFIGVDYTGISNAKRKWSDADYWKHFGEIGLYLYEEYSEIESPNAQYYEWRDSPYVEEKAGEFFASTNHCLLYCYDGKYWNPVTFLKKGTIIHSQYDNSTYVSNGTTLTKIKTEKFITVEDICDVSMFGVSNFPNKTYPIGSKGLLHEPSTRYQPDDRIGVYIREDVDEYTFWKKYSDLAYGDKFIVLREERFNSDEPCIHEYVENSGTVEHYFNRYNLEVGTTIFSKNNGKIYFYDGTTVKLLEPKEQPLDISVVTEIVRAGDENVILSIYETALKKGDKVLRIKEKKIYTVTEDYLVYEDGIALDDGVALNDGDKYVSLTDFKIYTNNKVVEIPKGHMFLNEADGFMYYLNGTELRRLVNG